MKYSCLDSKNTIIYHETRKTEAEGDKDLTGTWGNGDHIVGVARRNANKIWKSNTSEAIECMVYCRKQ